MHLLLYLSALLLVPAAHIPLQPRVDACQAAIQDNIGDGLTAPTADGTAGIGIELESPQFYFLNRTCGNDDTNASKKKIVGGRTGTNWMLTADTGGGQGKLQAEYIFDGRSIKVGSGDAARAGAEAAADLIQWHPWTPRTNPSQPNTLDVAESRCNPWKIEGPGLRTDPAKVYWSPQVTVPMPLEGLYSLMIEQRLNSKTVLVPGSLNILNGDTPRDTFKTNLVVVTQKFFVTSPNGMDASQVTDDVLGFCSLVLSYAKGAITPLANDMSPKLLITFMPRTEFNTLYNQVKSKIKGDLFTLFNTLACYNTDEKLNAAIDTKFCTGPTTNPVSNNKFGGLTYSNGATDPATSVNIKSWIEGIGSGTGAKDALSVFDESIDGSIGGLQTAMEKMYNSQRSVPLFEFRDLDYIPTSKIEEFMGKVDTSVQALHKAFANLPQKKKRDIPASCYVTNDSAATTSSLPPSITPAPTPSCELHEQDPDQGISQAFCLCDKSITLSVLPAKSAQSESCAYKSIPTATTARETVTTQREVWTTNCAACTIIGGIAGSETCTTVAGCTPTAAASPTIAAWIGNLTTIDIGNAEDGNGGKDLAAEMFGKLKAMCSGSTCKGDHAEMDNVEAAIANGDEPLKPAMYFQDAAYTSEDILEKMLALGIASWVAALNDVTLDLCKNVTYEADADETSSGCGKGPIPTSRIRRKIRRDTGEILYERRGLEAEDARLTERCEDNCDPPEKCHYTARMCSAPNEITVVMAGAGDPYKNRLNIGVMIDQEVGEGFSCKELIKELTAATEVLAPELIEANAFDDIEVEAICGFANHTSFDIETIMGIISRRGLEPVLA